MYPRPTKTQLLLLLYQKAGAAIFSVAGRDNTYYATHPGLETVRACACVIDPMVMVGWLTRGSGRARRYLYITGEGTRLCDEALEAAEPTFVVPGTPVAKTHTAGGERP